MLEGHKLIARVRILNLLLNNSYKLNSTIKSGKQVKPLLSLRTNQRVYLVGSKFMVLCGLRS